MVGQRPVASQEVVYLFDRDRLHINVAIKPVAE
jgi:hypothetical protein